MRTKQLWAYFPLPAKLKLMWDRLTFSRITTFYFLFSVAHCLIQVVFQTQAFVINEQAAALLYDVILQGNATEMGFPVLGSDLRSCDDVPSEISASSCSVVWSPKNSSTPVNQATVAHADAVNTSVPSPSTSASVTATTSVVPFASAFPPTVKNATPVTASSTSRPSADLGTSSASKTTVTVIAVETGLSHAQEDDNDKELQSRAVTIDGATIVASKAHGSTTVNITGLDGTSMVLDQTCLQALNWPVFVLLNTKREDIAFTAFQFWVLGMSTVALLNESIPHIIASLLTHMLATAWGGFQISNTASFHANFARLTTNGACQHHNLLPEYWKDRGNAEIPSLVLNIVALFVSAFLSWRLVKLFGWQTFKRVGASLTVNRVYKAVLTLSITIQLSLFFIVVTVALWLDQLWNGSIAHFATSATLYKVTFSITLVMLIPWLMTGWFAVRREAKRPMMVFLVLCILYLGGWGAMFAATTFRWTFVEWRFFGVIASASVLLTLITFVLGLVCRINFGKGLHRYLNAQEPLPGDDFEPALPDNGFSDPEKVEFPSNDKPIPTFSAAFGSGQEVPPPSQMFASRQKGPRFYNQNVEPFDSPDTIPPDPSRIEPPTESPVDSVRFPRPIPPLTRHSSHSSESSFSSFNSSESGNQRLKRWVIE